MPRGCEPAGRWRAVPAGSGVPRSAAVGPGTPLPWLCFWKWDDSSASCTAFGPGAEVSGAICAEGMPGRGRGTRGMLSCMCGSTESDRLEGAGVCRRSRAGEAGGPPRLRPVPPAPALCPQSPEGGSVVPILQGRRLRPREGLKGKSGTCRARPRLESSCGTLGMALGTSVPWVPPAPPGPHPAGAP